MERTEVSDNFDLTIEAQEGIKKIFQQIFNVFKFTRKETRFDAISFLFVTLCFSFSLWRIVFVDVSFMDYISSEKGYYLSMIELFNCFLCLFKLIMTINQSYLNIVPFMYVMIIFQISAFVLDYFVRDHDTYYFSNGTSFIFCFIDFCFMLIVFVNMIFHNPNKQHQTTNEQKEKEKEKESEKN